MKIPMMELITALAITHDGHFCLAGSASGTLYMWEVRHDIIRAERTCTK
jgi:hypothetical protein